MFYKYLFGYIGIILLLLIVTCHESGQNPQDTVIELPTENLYYENDIRDLFILKCSNPERVGGCHISPEFVRGLDLGTYAVILNHQVASGGPLIFYDEVSGTGDGKGSYLYLILTQPMSGTSRMPKNLPILSANNVNAVKVWIDEGLKEKPAN
jgi:hypothetical protein